MEIQELKAQAYDTIALLEVAQNQLNTHRTTLNDINQKIKEAFEAAQKKEVAAELVNAEP